MKLPKIDGPQAAVIVSIVIATTAICVLAPAEYRAPIVALLTALAGLARSPTSPT